jgi:cell wall-associated NlpC family hydrolase
VRDWYAEQGIELRDWDRPTTPEEFNDDCWEGIGFKEVKVEEMQKGDALLMAIDSNKLNHVGVYIGDQMVLHHLRGRLSSRDLLGEWLLKCTGKVLRYDA